MVKVLFVGELCTTAAVSLEFAFKEQPFVLVMKNVSEPSNPPDE